jgi:hypothetical protein
MMQNNWAKEALCFNHPERNIWFSYKKEDTDRAVNICKKCPVREKCFITAWNTGDFYGVYGGVTEFNYLNLTWKEAKSEKQNNRTRTDRVLKGILQEFQ